MTPERVRSSSGSSRVVTVVALLAALVVTRFLFGSLVAEQQPKQFPDSRDFLEAAAEPASVNQLFYPKPIGVPTVYRALGGNPLAIRSFQQELAFWSWWTFGLSLYAYAGRPLARALTLVVTAALVLAPLRVGWTSALLSESISDSLLALVLAAGVWLGAAAARLAPSQRRTTVCTGLGLLFLLLAAAWALTRDTNALSLFAAVAAGAVLRWKTFASGRDLRSLALALLLLVVSIAVLRTSTVDPGPSTRHALRASWDEAARPRGVYPMANNVLSRVLPDPRAVAFFRAHGMPWPPEIEKYQGRMANHRRHRFFTEPELRSVVQWIRAHGTSTYLKWLALHPIERAQEVFEKGWVLLGVRDLPDWLYMPKGWIEPLERFPTLEPLRQASRSWIVVLGALLFAPFWFVRAGPGAVRDIALCTLAGGIAGTLAAYYGDAMETGRHCWGPAQQIVVALAMLAIAWLDAPGRPRREAA